MPSFCAASTFFELFGININHIHARIVCDSAAAICARIDLPLELLPGKSVVEIKYAGFNKGTAVRQLMTYPPFTGRAPIFVGDDRTDEDAFAVVPEFNGHAMSVGRKIPGIDCRFQSPSDVRHWLERMSGAVVVSQ